MTKSALKSLTFRAFGAAVILAATSLSVPQIATAGAKAEVCKPVKAKGHKAKIHKTKAKAKAVKAKTVAVAQKTKAKPKVTKVATTPCDCRRQVKVVKVIQPVIEREVTVYRAEPRPEHAPYVDEVASGRYATYDEAAYSETYEETSEHHYERRTYSSDRTDYLTTDTRPGRHKHKRWTSWME